MRQLAAQDNPLSDLRAISGLTELRELHLEQTVIDSLEPLRGLPNLRRLWIYGTRVTSHRSLSSAEIAAFRSARPDVRID